MLSRRLFHTTRSLFAEAAQASTGSNLVINFVTPHLPIFEKKAVASVNLPGEAGEFGLTFGHSPLISQLKPGVVTVTHLGGEVEKYFVAGGFALAKANSVTDISVSEAFPLTDFDESAVRAGHAEAAKNVTSDNVNVKTTAQIELGVYTALARALNITL